MPIKDAPRCTKETFLKWSDVNMNLFPVLRSISSGTIEINLRSCVWNRHKLRQSQIATSQEFLPSQFVICRNLWSRPWRGILTPITLKTCPGYLGEYPGSILTWIWKLHFCPFWCFFNGISVCMYISYQVLKRCSRDTFLKLSDVYVIAFSVLRSIPSGTIDINLRSCVLNRHKLRQSQIATKQESLPSQFVICRNLWPSQFRGKFSPITLKMCSAYLGEYPCSLLTGIWEIEFSPISVLFAICIVYNSPNMRCRNEPKECV